MLDSVFRAYDVRGKVGSEFMIENVYALTCAIVYHCIQKKRSVKTVAVGMDGRIHSEAIKHEILRALVDSGLDVIDIGLCSTPLLYFSQYWLPVDMGLMVTASHNPPEDNGIKIVVHRYSVAGEEIKNIKELFKSRKRVSISQLGSLTSRSLTQDYCLFLKRLFPHLVGITLNGVFDCGNAVVGPVLVELIKQMEWKKVHLLYETIDGTMPNHTADPSVEANMHDLKVTVEERGLSFGIAFDGDGDRMGAVTDKGNFIPGDVLLALYAQDVCRESEGAMVVFDCKCSSVIEEVVKGKSGKSFMSPSGTSYIKKIMEEQGALLGGELSAHFFFKDRYFGFDDGLYAALRLVEIIQKTGKSLEELVQTVPHMISSPEMRIECKEGDGPKIVAAVETFLKSKQCFKINTLDGVRFTSSYGWGLLRSSNTQPMICLRFESDSIEGIEFLRKECITALSSWYSVSFLEERITWRG